jgi:acetylornithine deacetylase
MLVYCLVSLLATTCPFLCQSKFTPHTIVGSAEEESAVKKGLNSVLQHLPELECAIVRTYPNAIGYSRKRVIGLDVKIKGTPSHAHQNDDNAIYKTIPVMEWFKTIISRKYQSN